MKKVVYKCVCDRCGAEFDSEKKFDQASTFLGKAQDLYRYPTDRCLFPTDDVFIEMRFPGNIHRNTTDVDLCDECKKEFVKWFINPKLEEEEER